MPEQVLGAAQLVMHALAHRELECVALRGERGDPSPRNSDFTFLPEFRFLPEGLGVPRIPHGRGSDLRHDGSLHSFGDVKNWSYGQLLGRFDCKNASWQIWLRESLRQQLSDPIVGLSRGRREQLLRRLLGEVMGEQHDGAQRQRAIGDADQDTSESPSGARRPDALVGDVLGHAQRPDAIPEHGGIAVFEIELAAAEFRHVDQEPGGGRAVLGGDCEQLATKHGVAEMRYRSLNHGTLDGGGHRRQER